MARPLTALLFLGALSGAMAMDGADYLHGRAQLEQLLADRPALTTHLVADDPLLTWTAARFGGAVTGFRVDWDARRPPDGIEAQHRHPLAGRPYIRLHDRHQTGPARGVAKDFHAAWADLIFELYNIARHQEFTDAYRSVLAGEIGYRGWIEALTRAEHRALLATGSFYRKRWRIWMRRRGMRPDHPRWNRILAVPPQYPHWIRGYTDPRGYPFSAYGRYFRDVLEPLLRSQGLDLQDNPFRLSDLPPPR